MKRRELFAVLPASFLATVFSPRLSSAQPAGLSGLVDSHVHIFNMTDIPWLQFLWTVQFQQFEEAHRFEDWEPSFWDLIAGAVALLTASLTNAGAPHAETERGGYVESVGIEAAREQARANYLAALALSLRQLEENSEGFARSYFPPFEGELGPRRVESSVELPPLRWEFDAQRATALLRSELAALTGEASPEEAAEKLLQQDDWLSRFSQFGLLLTSFRVDNCDRLITTYASGRKALFTPALVDFSGWLDGLPKSGLSDQLLAMDVVQRTASGPVAMQMPFNPWTQLRAEKDGMTGYTPIDLLRQGFERLGALGIKLYPPMGFLPAGNATANLAYPDRAWRDFGEEFPAQLDDALRRLYTMCAEFDAPILSHTHNGNGVGVDFGSRAHPRHWATVFSDWGFGTLRVATAHFGSFDQDPFWEDSTVSLMDDSAGNLFADLSYLRAVLPDYAPAQREIVCRRLGELPAAAWDQIIYASDWHMLVQERGAEAYPHFIDALLADLQLSADRKDQVFRGNAIRLFGLAAGRQQRQRLEDYYVAANRQDLAEILAELADA